jgi:hypothetical protein
MATRTYIGNTDSSGNANIYRANSAVETAVILGLTGYGIDFKVWGGTAGDYMMWDNSVNQFGINATLALWNSTAMQIYGAPTATTVGTRNGTVNITTRRDAVWATWDGNADIGLKVLSYNYSVSLTNGRILAVEVLARNRTGSCYSVHGGYFTAENYNGAGNIADLIAFEVHAKQNSVATGNVKALRVMDESGSSTGTHYGIELTTGDGAFMRDYGIMIDCNAAVGAGWTNAISFNGAITNVLDFENSDGTNGATLHEHGHTLSGAGVKIRIDVAGTPYYILAGATATDA